MGPDGGAGSAEPLDESIRFVLEAADFGWWHLDMATNTTSRSLKHDQLFGYAEMLPSWTYDDYLAHVHPDDRELVAESFATALSGGEPYAVDVRVVWPDGSTHWLATRGRFLLDANEAPVRVAGVVADINDRKLSELAAADQKANAERDLSETVALLETLLKSAPVGFAFVDREVRFVRVNDALAEINGIAAADHLGRPVHEVVPQLWPQLEPLYDGVLQTGRAVLGVEVVGETAAQPGVQRDWVVSYYPVRVQDGGDVIGVGVVALEVTENRRLESHLRQAQKLEALGLLAGGVAHDVNNALAAIILSADLAARKPVRDDLDTHLDRILMAAESTRRLTQQLLLFSRQEHGASGVVDVIAEVEEVLYLLSGVLGEHITLELDLQPVPSARMDPSALNQVMVNLAINARDAMPSGGNLSVATSTVTVADVIGLADGQYVELLVADTGHGMSREVLERAFEPFFTTRAASGGTGLGLATVYGLVERANGQVTIESSSGSGTSIRILLPETLDAPDDQATVQAVAPGQGQRVLVVEDRMVLRHSIHQVLTAAGYVVTSGTAQDVLDEDSKQHPPDLLLTDVVMPGVSGPELARELSERWPNLRVLFMSGYTDGMLAGHGVDPDAVKMLRKPFTTQDLLRAVAGCLGMPIA